MRAVVIAGLLSGCAVAERTPVRDPALASAQAIAPAASANDVASRKPAADDLLAFVPADTPYVVAVLQPAPKDYVRRIDKVLAPLREAIQLAIDRTDPSSLDPRSRAVLRELDGRIDADGLRQLGFDPNPTLVLYGIGLAPVLRLRLHDPSKVEGFFRRIDAAGSDPWPRWNRDGVQGWRITQGQTSIAWAIVDRDLVVTIYPRAAEAQVLPLALRPSSRSLAQIGWAQAMKKEHGLVAHGLGRVDLRALTDAWVGRGAGVLSTTARAWGLAPHDEPCVAALTHIVARAPEIVFGVTELSDAVARGRWVWRMDAPLVADLAEIAGPIPKTADGIAKAGFALDLQASEAIARRWASDLHRVAPGCVEADALATFTLPESIATIQGGAATLHAFDPRKDTIGYTVVLGLSDPERWLAAVRPDLSLREWPKRRPVAAQKIVPLAVPLVDPSDAFVARTDDAIALAAGPRARAHARRAARASGRDDDTLLCLHFAFSDLKKAIPPRMLRRALADLDPLQRRLAEGMLDLLGDYDARLFVDDAGLVADWSLRLR